MADPQISNDDIQHGGCVSDALTVVRSVSPNKPLAKVHTWETENRLRPKINRQAYSRALYVVSEQLPVGSIHDLHRALITLQGEQHKAVIRGQPAEGLDALLPHRRLAKSKTDGRTGAVTPASYQPKPRQWLAIDMDDIPNAEGHDPAVDPDGALEYLRSQLPPCFHEVTCAAQWTSSQNIDVVEGGRSEPEYLGARLWFWLDRPVSDQQNKDWLDAKDDTGRKFWPVDPSLYQPVGIHYTAAPIWTNGPEILPSRVTFWEGETDIVTVPEITPGAASRRRMIGDESAPRMVSTIADTMTPEGLKKAVDGLASIWPRGPGNRHTLSLAFAGYLLRRGVSEPEAAFILQAGTAQAGDDEPDKRALNVETTADAMRSGHPVTGFPGIIDEIGDAAAETFAKAVSVKRTAVLPLPQVAPHYPAAGLVSLTEATARAEAAIDAFWLKAAAHNGWTDGGAVTPASSDFADIDKAKGAAPVDALNITMGGGKTHITIDRADHLPDGETMLHFVPDHSLSGELRDRYAADGVSARIVRGITQIGDNGEPMCHHVKTMQAWRANGQAGFDLCQVCPDRIGCNTEAQRAAKDQPGVIIAPHSYLTMADEHRPFPAPDIAFIDESPLDASLRGVDTTVAFPLDVLGQWTDFQDGARASNIHDSLIVGASRTADVNEIMRLIHDAIGRGGLTAEAFRDAGVTASDCKLAAGAWYGRAVKLDPAALGGDFSAEAIEAAAANSHGDPKARTIARFFRLLERYLQDDWQGSGAFNAFEIETATAPDGGEYQSIRMAWRASFKLACPIMLMDGTLNEAVAGKLVPALDDVTSIRIEATHIRAVQIESELSKQRLGALHTQSAADKKTAAKHARQIVDMADVQAVNQTADANGCRAQIVTYKATREAIKREYADRVEDDCPQYTRLSGGIEIAHLGNIRGADRWKDTGATIIAGRPLPTAEALERVTRALYWDDPKPIDSVLPGGQLPREVRGIRMRDGGGLGVEMASHPDERCRALLDQITRAEIEQTMHRLRLIRRTADNPATVILATCTVVDADIDRVTTWAALAPNPVELMQARGVMPNDWPTRAAVLADRFSSAKSVKDWFSRNPLEKAELVNALDALKSSHSPFIGNKGNLRQFRPYRYQPAQGYARTGYIDLMRHPDPRASMAFWIGDAAASTLTVEASDYGGLSSSSAPPFNSVEKRADTSAKGFFAPGKETVEPNNIDTFRTQYAPARGEAPPEQQPPLPGASWIEPKAITTPTLPRCRPVPEPEWLDLPREQSLFADVGGLPADGDPDRLNWHEALAYAETGGKLPDNLAGSFNAVVRYRWMDHDAAAREAGAGSRSHLSNARHEKYGLSPDKARALVAWIARHCGHDMPDPAPMPPGDKKRKGYHDDNGATNSPRLPARPPSNENGPSDTLGSQRLAE